MQRTTLWKLPSFWCLQLLILSVTFLPEIIPQFHFFAYEQFIEIRFAPPGTVYYFVKTPQRWIPYTEMKKQKASLQFKNWNGEWETYPAEETKWLTHRYYLGSDRLGRDFLYRLILGGRYSLFIGLFAMSIGLLLGSLLGMLAGSGPRWLDRIILWFMTTFWSIPSVLLAMALAFTFGKGIGNLVLTIGLVIWTDIARIIRGETLKLKALEFMHAAKVIGVPTHRVFLKYLLPNVAPYLWVLGANAAATAILLESGLSFLGFGLRPPLPSWGILLKEHYPYVFIRAYWHLALLPGAMIMITILLIRLISLQFSIKK